MEHETLHVKTVSCFRRWCSIRFQVCLDL